MVQHPSSVPVVEDEPAHSAQQAPVWKQYEIILFQDFRLICL
jgi:hypothetical protein